MPGLILGDHLLSRESETAGTTTSPTTRTTPDPIQSLRRERHGVPEALQPHRTRPTDLLGLAPRVATVREPQPTITTTTCGLHLPSRTPSEQRQLWQVFLQHLGRHAHHRDRNARGRQHRGPAGRVRVGAGLENPSRSSSRARGDLRIPNPPGAASSQVRGHAGNGLQTPGAWRGAWRDRGGPGVMPRHATGGHGR